MPEEIRKHKNENDHEIWFQCFIAALSGTATHSADPTQIASDAARIADAALGQEWPRRHEPDYQVFSVGGRGRPGS